MYWQGRDAKAVLMLIPGGEGYIGLKPEQTDLKFHQYQTLKKLTDPVLSSGHFDVVILDSPAQLSPNQPYPSERGSFDHLIRIESTIRYYKKRTGLPVVLMGHSNGGISLTEFLKYARKNNKMDLIGGYVVSAVRSESYFDGAIPFPILFMHHELDGCARTAISASLRNFEQLKASNGAPMEFATIHGGQAEPKDPCRSGFHMYYGAGEEVAQHLDHFMSDNYK